MGILVFAMILVLLVVTFALQNSEIINVTLWLWDFQSSLALLLIITMCVGALIAGSVLMRVVVKKNSEIRKLKKSLAAQKTTTATPGINVESTITKKQS